MPSLPDFTHQGRLPPGDYELTLNELRASFLVQGPVGYPDWDMVWRAQLVDNLEILVHQLWQVGITEIYIGGSFVEDIDHPNDIDGYFTCDPSRWISGEIKATLNRLDPDHIWEWDSSARKRHPDAAVPKIPMWHRYRVELYPEYGQGSGILDRFGNELTFPPAFRLPRWGRNRRGIVKIGGPA